MSEKEQYLLHELVARVVVVHGQKILVLRRSQTDRSRPGQYELPGGRVDAGENLEQGAVRELAEEAGINVAVEDLQFYRTFYYQAEGGEHRLGGVFIVSVDSPETTLSFEHDDAIWVDRSSYKNHNLDVTLAERFEGLYTDVFGPAEDAGETSTPVSDFSADGAVEEMHIFTDGGSRGNPGPAATGYVLMTKDEAVIAEGGSYLGVATNNVAEYQAVSEAIDAAVKFKPKKILFFLDSMLAVKQLKGEWKMKSEDLKPIHAEILRKVQQFEETDFTHVRRKYNTLADAEVNKVLDDVEAQNSSS